METNTVDIERECDSIREDVKHFFNLSNEQIFSIDAQAIQNVQLHWLKKRFHELRPKLSAIQRLTDDIGLSDVTDFNDVVPALLPHTIYKSYSAKAFEQRNFRALTQWLSRFTSHRIDDVDLSNCTTVDSWINALREHTPLRPVCSSGTSGKISLFPRSSLEERAYAEGLYLKITDGYFDEPKLPLRSGEASVVVPWPVRSGPQAVPALLGVLQKVCFNGNPDKVITIGTGHQSADELALAGKLRKAESLGENLSLTPYEEETLKALAERNASAPRSLETFIEKAVVQQAGKKVLCGVVGPTMYQLAMACKERGIVAQWDPESLFISGGGSKGFALPDDWKDVVLEVFPGIWRDGYGMSESTSSAHACSHGNLHFYPWGIPYVLDPETSMPLPREGVQTGRFAIFDLMAESYWGGLITGDKVTMHWDGGCGCGRAGAFLANDIGRIAAPGDADEKISCAKTPGAYERLEEFSIVGLGAAR